MRDKFRPLFLSAVLVTFAAWFSPTITAVSGGTGITVTASGTSRTVAITNVGTAGTYAYPSSVTTNAQGQVTAITAGSAPTGTGGVVTISFLGANATWTANNYLGFNAQNASAGSVVAWTTPVAGTLNAVNFSSATSAVSGTTNIRIYKGTYGGTTTGCSFASTSAVMTLATGDSSGNDSAHSVSLAANDCLVTRTDASYATGNPGGFTVSGRFIPN